MPGGKVEVVQVKEPMILQDVWQMSRLGCREKKTKRPEEPKVVMEGMEVEVLVLEIVAEEMQEGRVDWEVKVQTMMQVGSMEWGEEI